MDYIKRSVVVQKVMETKWESGSDGAVAMEIVAATPAADVAPVTHGEWIEDDYGYNRCSAFCRIIVPAAEQKWTRNNCAAQKSPLSRRRR